MRSASLLLLSLGVTVLCTPLEAQQSTSTNLADGAPARIEQALRAQDNPGAIREYRAMVTADPKNGDAWTGLGILLYGSGYAAEAADALSQALKINPSAVRAELFLGLSQADMRECDKALPVLTKYFASEPVGKLQRLTGMTLLQCSLKDKDSVTALRTAVQMKKDYPGDPDVLYESAELFTRMWSETANELITSHPESYRVHQLAGEVNEAQGNLAQAIRQYKAALGENPKLPQMHYRIGQLILRSGEPDADEKAMEEFRAELALDPQSAMSALAMGEIDRHQGKLVEATADYTRAMRLEAGLPEAQVGLAQTLVAQHQIDAAQAQLRTLIAQHPENAQAHYVMMLTLREQGKLQEATVEMATFKKLQQNGADQFQKKLNALLTGSAETAPSGAATSPNE